jgi:hypothetical protein
VKGEWWRIEGHVWWSERLVVVIAISARVHTRSISRGERGAQATFFTPRHDWTITFFSYDSTVYISRVVMEERARAY